MQHGLLVVIFPPCIDPVLHGLGELVLRGGRQNMAREAGKSWRRSAIRQRRMIQKRTDLEAHVYLAEGAALGHDGPETLAQRANLVHLTVNLRQQ